MVLRIRDTLTRIATESYRENRTADTFTTFRLRLRMKFTPQQRA
jgi:hypothetical protein